MLDIKVDKMPSYLKAVEGLTLSLATSGGDLIFQSDSFTLATTEFSTGSVTLNTFDYDGTDKDIQSEVTFLIEITLESEL